MTLPTLRKLAGFGCLRSAKSALPAGRVTQKGSENAPIRGRGLGSGEPNKAMTSNGEGLHRSALVGNGMAERPAPGPHATPDGSTR